MRVILTRATRLAFAFYLIFGERLTITASTGGRGAISVPEVLFLVLSLTLWLALKIKVEGPQAKGLTLASIGPLFTLLLVLPVIGVFAGDYELRALYSFIVVLVPLSILALGTAGARWGVDIRGAVFVAVLAHGLYGFGQLLSRIGILPNALWAWATNWDMQTQAAYSDAYVISARSTGLFVNPNEFGLWSVLAVIFGALYLRGRRQVITVLTGAIGVFASQSRTAWLVLSLLALVGLVVALRRPGTFKIGFITTVLVGAAVGLLASLGIFARFVEAGAVSRFDTGFGAIFGGGASEDVNLSSRYVGWERAAEFVQDYTFGTLGPPQLKFGGSIDNQFVSYYLQGGLLLVAAYALMLIAPFLMLSVRLAQPWKLMVVAAAFAIYSYTANPMDTPITSSIAWVCVILSVQSSLRRCHAGQTNHSSAPETTSQIDLNPPHPARRRGF